LTTNLQQHIGKMDMTYCQLTSHLNPFNQSVMDLSQVQLTSNDCLMSVQLKPNY